MSSPRTETAVRPDPSAGEPRKTSLSAVQVAAGALAAVSSAVVASFFGVAGTLIGAALASVISTVSAALYSESLNKTNNRLRRVREQLTSRQAPAAVATRPTPAAAATRPAPAVPATKALPARLDPRRAPARGRGPRWGRVGVYAAAVFLVAMGIVTGVELIGQKPVSALVGNSHATGTTIGELTNAASHRDQTPATPSPPSTGAPATSTSGGSPSATRSTGSDGPTPTQRSATSAPTTQRSSSSSAESTRSAGTSSAPATSAPQASSSPTP
jgi:hypothetical protein